MDLKDGKVGKPPVVLRDEEKAELSKECWFGSG